LGFVEGELAERHRCAVIGVLTHLENVPTMSQKANELWLVRSSTADACSVPLDLWSLSSGARLPRLPEPLCFGSQKTVLNFTYAIGCVLR
jgi:hypothetical protein